jgi:hypothetical protein
MGVIQRPRFQPEAKIPQPCAILRHNIKKRRSNAFQTVTKTSDEIRTVTVTTDEAGNKIEQIHRVLRDPRHEPSDYNETRAFIADECGVPYIAVDEGIYDIEAPTKDLPPTVGDDGTPGSVYRLDEGAIAQATKDAREIATTPPALTYTENGIMTHDSIEREAEHLLGRVLMGVGAI